MHLTTRSLPCSCPYCGEGIELVVDPSVPEQEYVEDCFVCCRPIVVNVVVAGEDVTVLTRSEDEA
jgi:hypothetical protein